MNMGLVMAVLIWLAAPFVELVIIIVLLVSNSRYRRQIWELTAGRERQPAVKMAAELEEMELTTEAKMEGEAEAVEETASAMKDGWHRGEYAVEKAKDSPFGTAALMIGVIFVVIAGLIFATTAWNVLPNTGKALLVLAASGVFFGASWLAESRLHIQRTGNACYVLGSLFLFLFVIAAAYFEVLMPEFILCRRNRWLVLWIGSIVTECAFFAGLKRFHDRIYTQISLWGVTVSGIFMAGALQTGLDGWINDMMLYAAALVILQQGILRSRRKGGDGDSSNGDSSNGDDSGTGYIDMLLEGLRSFVPIHFWVFAALVMVYGCTRIGIWLLGDYGAANMSISHFCSMAAMTAGAAVLAWNQKSRWNTIFFAVAASVLAQYCAFLAPVHVSGQCCLAAAAISPWLLLVQKQEGWKCLNKDGIHMVFLILNTGCSLRYALSAVGGMSELLAASATVVFLAAALGQWGKKRSCVRLFIPGSLWLLTLTGYEMLDRSFPDLHSVTYEMLLFAFLFGIMLWDLWRKDVFCLPVLVMGTLAQTGYFWQKEVTAPFALLIAGYLLAKGYFRKEEPAGCLYSMSGCYFLLGVYVLSCRFTDVQVMRMTAVNLLFGAVGLARSVGVHRKTPDGCDGQYHPLIWDICGCSAFLFTITGFYWDGDAGLGELVLCMAAFTGYFIWFYKGNRQWPHFLAALSMVPVPFLLGERLLMTENGRYAAVGAVLLISGLLCRKLLPVLKRAEGVRGGWRVNWYQVCSVFVLIGMLPKASDVWQFLYLLLLALNILQFAAAERLRKGAIFLAACALGAAYLEQPFIEWPDIIGLECRMLPFVLLIWLAGRQWKEREGVRALQTAGYVICLVILCFNVLLFGSLANAMILEAVCLAIFLWAQVKKNGSWVRISGIFLILVVVFLTKEFWLSISWWIYLLAAGIGLIIFAAKNERRKH